MNAQELSDNIAELMKEAGQLEYIDWGSRERVLGNFFSLRHQLILLTKDGQIQDNSVLQRIEEGEKSNRKGINIRGSTVPL